MGVRREERMTMSVGSLVRIEARPRRMGLAILKEERGVFGGRVVCLFCLLSGLSSNCTIARQRRRQQVLKHQLKLECGYESRGRERERDREGMRNERNTNT